MTLPEMGSGAVVRSTPSRDVRSTPSRAAPSGSRASRASVLRTTPWNFFRLYQERRGAPPLDPAKGKPLEPYTWRVIVIAGWYYWGASVNVLASFLVDRYFFLYPTAR